MSTAAAGSPGIAKTGKPPGRTLSQYLFEPRDLQTMAPAAKIGTYLLLLVWAFVVLFPLYWNVITSLKLPIQVDDGPDYLPFIDFAPSGHAWHYIFVDLGPDTFRPYLNSVIIALSSTALAVLIGSFAAYALVRIQFQIKIASVVTFILLIAAVVYATWQLGVPWAIALPVAIGLFLLFVITLARHFRRALGNNDIQFWIISNRIMPPIVAVIPIYVMFQQVQLLDTHIGIIATYTAVNLPIVVWLMRDFFAGIPIDLEESAQIDGASKLRIFFTIVMPLARAGLVATSLLVLILSWNEYLLALFLSTADAQTLPLLVAAQNATRGPQWWYMSVLMVIMIAPVIVITTLLQKHLARGLLLGAIKG